MSAPAKGSSTIRRAVVLAIGVIASVISFAPTCLACPCEHKDEEERFEESDLIFTGRVTEAHERPDGDRVWRFDVQSSQKGERLETVDIVSGPRSDTCAPTFTLNNRYQVFAKTEDGDFRTDFCMGTKAVGGSVWPYPGTQDGPTPKPHGGRPVPDPGEQPALQVFDERVEDPRGSEDDARDGTSTTQDNTKPDTDTPAIGEDGTHVVEAAGESVASAARPNLFRDYAVTIAVWAAVGLPVVWMLRRRRVRA